MSAVSVRELSKSFGSLRVLRDIDLPVEAGEFTVLLGPSGCGKSTLLNAIAGLEDIDSGTVEIGGIDVTHHEPSTRGIAMVFQSYALYPTMSVRGNLSFGLAHAADRRAARPQAIPAVRRTAAARGDRARAGAAGQGVPVR
jgi:multiple sugar transport system ATP-binding protein